MQVIWAIGCSMIALAALVWLPPVSVLAIGVAIVAGHNLLDPNAPEDFGRAAFLWRLLHEGGPITGVANPIGIVLYPILPWAGVMALGYGCGPLLTLEPTRRDRLVPAAGLAMLSTFAVLRGARLYGDPTAWDMHQTWVATTMSFFDVTNYPPSLHYVLVTLGLAFTISGHCSRGYVVAGPTSWSNAGWCPCSSMWSTSISRTRSRWLRTPRPAATLPGCSTRSARRC